MKLTFVGAAHEVTGSCHVLELNGNYILLDCGMEQGRDIYVNAPLPCDRSEVKAVILSHAHMDHSGMIPWLYAGGFRGPVYCTGATRDLCSIMLQDSAHIQESEAEWKSRKNRRAGLPEVEPIYTVRDAQSVMEQFVAVDYKKRFVVLPGELEGHFEDAGHLLGSATVNLKLTEGFVTKELVFSGDLGNINQPLIRDPGVRKKADYVLTESTYGDRLHGETPDYIGPLTKLMQETFDRGGNLVIPCFAVGRTQQMLYFMRKIIQEKRVRCPGGIRVIVDSPLAVEATKIFEKDVFGYFDEDALDLIRQGVNPIRFEGLELAVTSEESKAINFDERPKVILSASGMCDAGRIRHHLKHNLWRAESTILFVGYQAEGTLGAKLLAGATKVKLFGEEIDVRARIERLQGMSGHADKEGLIRWMTSVSDHPTQIFVVHGEDQTCDHFAEELRQRCGLSAIAPYTGDVYDLAAGEWVSRVTPVPASAKKALPKVKTLLDLLREAGQRLLGVISRQNGRTNAELSAFTNDVNALCEKWDRVPSAEDEAQKGK